MRRGWTVFAVVTMFLLAACQGVLRLATRKVVVQGG